ncbi:MAG TPA: glycine betaine ABC transporter substrate-binding protein [Solirubrobacteraceae bacterium]|nr:glycine betaine ABC transporter substrate-binding protein [Solirubrobacteraceae bacterium]
MSARRTITASAVGLTLSAGLIAGLGAGIASAGHARTAAAATMATVPTQPAVTTVATPTTPATGLPGYNKPTVLLGDMNTPQQFVIGQLYKLALEQQGYTVNLTRNIGAIHTAQVALEGGTLDLYPNYVGMWNSLVAHLHQRFKTLSASYAAGKAYARKHGFVLLPPTPFSDTHGLAVTSEYAQQNHVNSIRELARGPGIIIAAPLEFETGPDGLPALAEAYHLHPGVVKEIDVGSQYMWLESGNVQAAYVDTTDPNLGRPAFRELKDPKHVFGFGNVVPVTTPEELTAEGPAFKRTIEGVDALLTLRAIRGLDYEAAVSRHEPASIAREFLQGYGILPPTVYAPVATATGS